MKKAELSLPYKGNWFNINGMDHMNFKGEEYNVKF